MVEEDTFPGDTICEVPASVIFDGTDQSDTFSQIYSEAEDTLFDTPDSKSAHEGAIMPVPRGKVFRFSRLNTLMVLAAICVLATIVVASSVIAGGSQSRGGQSPKSETNLSNESPVAPIYMSVHPSVFPSQWPSEAPSLPPSVLASMAPSPTPSSPPSSFPSISPSSEPSQLLSLSTKVPTAFPSWRPSAVSTTPTPLTSEFPTLSNTQETCPDFPIPPPLPGKKGVCMTLRSEGRNGSWRENIPRIEVLNAYWNYKWGLERVEAQPADLEFVPMLWGGAKSPRELQRALEEHVLPHIKTGGTQRFMGFNEPDKEEQSNVSVKKALRIWPQLQNLGLSMVSPSCANPLGDWMQEFMLNATSDCLRVDWIGVHWYGGVNARSFKKRMKSIYRMYGKPLLLTEFAPADYSATTVQNNRHTRHEVLAFAKEVLPWLEIQPWIVGYAWFPFDINVPHGTSSALFDDSGRLTPLGRYYASVRTDTPSGDQSI